MIPRGAIGQLCRVWAAQERGADEQHDTVVPPHLTDVPWKFYCRCRDPVLLVTSATIRDGRLVPPRHFCPTCLTWNDGRPVSPESAGRMSQRP